MPQPLLSILLYLSQAAKKNQTGTVFCHWCNNRINFIKYGKYQRYDFTGDELIAIQRYLCKHDQCRRTFSILPHPFLRITRFSLCMFNALMQLFDQQLTVAQIERRFGQSRRVITAAIEKGLTIMRWLDQEIPTEPIWAPGPCMDPPCYWSEFVRMFAAKFYPQRYGATPPTEFENLQ